MKHIIYTKKPYKNTLIGYVTLNRPERGNAITPQMSSELLEVFHDKSIRALVIKGAGKFFCTGMDLANASQAETSNNDNDGQKIFSALSQLLIPTICVLNGNAYGGGVGLAFCCDIRIAVREDLYLQLSESKRGLVPALISPWIIKTMGRCTEFFLGSKMSAKRLYELGVVNKIIKEDKEIDYYLDLIVESAPKATSMIKELILKFNKPTKEELDFVKQMFGRMIKNEEAMFGMTAFLEKRKPDWSKL